MTRATRQVVQFVLVGVLAALLVAAYLAGRGGQASAPTDRPPSASVSAVATADAPDGALAWVDESALPQQARQTLALIRRGGPYPYPRNDDQPFGNREGVLPDRPSGYYREFTVTTPGESDRGPRRIVVGRGGEIYYTDDHYVSFRRVREGR